MVTRLRTALASAASLAAILGAARLRTQDGGASELERSFAGTVRPFLETYCVSCHGKEKPKGKLDLTAFATLESVLDGHRRWRTVLEKLEAEEMPPEDAKTQPPPELRRSIATWIREARKHGAERSAGDPGPVLAHRLSNAEYDYSIRDLTGVDMRPTREMPVDPANEAGFDNTGESLAMSATLVTKHMDAARRVADQLVLLPKGFVFAPHAAVTETDRDKYCVKRIVDFYARQRTDLADYFLAAWRFRNRAGLGKPDAALSDFAAAASISPAYLATVRAALEEPANGGGPLAELQAKWQGLPAPAPSGDFTGVRETCERMRDFVTSSRKKLNPAIRNLSVQGMSQGSQTFVLWKDREMAANRRRYTAPASSAEAGSGPAPDPASLQRFCSVFPDAFYVPDRGLVVEVEETQGSGRLLSAGFHLMFGYFRDDAPLCDLLLDEAGRRELDALWQELDFITLAPLRQYRDFVFFERAEPPRFLQGEEFDFARSEDKDVTSAEKLQRLAGGFIAKARKSGAEGKAIQAIEDYFRTIDADIRRVEAQRLAAEPSHLEALLDFARRAYRRPLSQPEREELLGFYGALRKESALSHEDALRDTVASILMSPFFCYRVDVASPDKPAGATSAPLSGHSLASRLSYFLWASLPDEELLAHAATGDLHRPEVLVAQTRRMIADDRVRGLATEFLGNWLDFRRFEEHNSVDRERFPTFTNELRQAMFEEPLRFFMDLVRKDRSILDLVEADRTFVNPILAKHYEMAGVDGQPDEWTRVDGARKLGRGGLLPMAVFLTKNAPGLRTSPVKRGYWVVRRLLGEMVPPPPATVPELPADEGKLGTLTLREALVRHREDKSCSGCHARFDSIGLAFEGYGPIGELRKKDFAGHPVDTRAVFPGGGEGEGLEGLQGYLRARRQDELVENVCRKLFSYALGRSLLLSDDTTVNDMREKLATNGYRFGTLLESIITSPQFLRKRTRDGLPAPKDS